LLACRVSHLLSCVSVRACVCACVFVFASVCLCVCASGCLSVFFVCAGFGAEWERLGIIVAPAVSRFARKYSHSHSHPRKLVDPATCIPHTHTHTPTHSLSSCPHRGLVTRCSAVLLPGPRGSGSHACVWSVCVCGVCVPVCPLCEVCVAFVCSVCSVCLQCNVCVYGLMCVSMWANMLVRACVCVCVTTARERGRAHRQACAKDREARPRPTQRFLSVCLLSHSTAVHLASLSLVSPSTASRLPLSPRAAGPWGSGRGFER
jgi:hypothetical protein